jgi:ubiquitin-like 1-activating enzyme E1 A
MRWGFTNSRQLLLNDATRKGNVRFYAAATYGLYGFIFADLILHQFVVKRIKSNVTTQTGRETRTRSIITTTETKEGNTIWEFVTKEETYCPLSEAIHSEVDNKWRPRKRKMMPSILPGIKALWKFQQKFGRLPESTREDFAEFTRIMTEADRELALPEELVKAEFIRSASDSHPTPSCHVLMYIIRPFVENASAELSPVAAVLGGLLAQDAINVLGKMEQPIQNRLVFDGDISAAPIVVLALQREDQ